MIFSVESQKNVQNKCPKTLQEINLAKWQKRRKKTIFSILKTIIISIIFRLFKRCQMIFSYSFLRTIVIPFYVFDKNEPKK